MVSTVFCRLSMTATSIASSGKMFTFAIADSSSETSSEFIADGANMEYFSHRE